MHTPDTSVATPSTSSAPPPALDGTVHLAHWGLVRARGEDAAKFLHGQLTNDFSVLALGQARLAGFCSAKGRLQASFIGLKLAHDDLLLACHTSVLAATVKRLSMFVLRAKCKLTDEAASPSPGCAPAWWAAPPTAPSPLPNWAMRPPGSKLRWAAAT